MYPFFTIFFPVFPLVNCSMVFNVFSNIVVIFNPVFTGCCGMWSIADCWTVWLALKRVWKCSHNRFRMESFSVSSSFPSTLRKGSLSYYTIQIRLSRLRRIPFRHFKLANNNLIMRIQPLYIIQKRAMHICQKADYMAYTRLIFYQLKALAVQQDMVFNVYTYVLPWNIMLFFPEC